MSRWRENLAPWAAWTVALTLLFFAVYGTTNWWASTRSFHYRFYADWELAAPFVPWMIYVYLSINAAALLPLFTLRRHELRPFAVAVAAATLLAGAVFALFPAQIGFPRPASVPGHELAFRLLYAVDPPYNTLPSLHVCYSMLWTLAARPRVPPPARIALYAWLAALLASVILVHQHHLADLAAGAALGVACYAWFERRARRAASASPASPAAWAGSAR